MLTNIWGGLGEAQMQSIESAFSLSSSTYESPTMSLAVVVKAWYHRQLLYGLSVMQIIFALISL